MNKVLLALLIAVIILIILILVIVFAVKRFIRKVDRSVGGMASAFIKEIAGTDSSGTGFQAQAEELARTPKSVSSMTRIFEPQILRDFPEFSLNQFRNMVENLLSMALGAITTEKTENLRDCSREFKKQIENRINENKRQGITEFYEDIEIHQTEINNYVKKAGTCVITFQSAVGHYHYGKKDEKIIFGQENIKEQTKYNVEVIYIQDENLVNQDGVVGNTCPNCGAPITNLGVKTCEYCGLAVQEINLRVWSLHKFYQVGSQRI